MNKTPASIAMKFKPTRLELNSPCWMRLMEHFTDRLAQLRAENDVSKSYEETERLRGRIAEIKGLMAFDREYE